MQAVKVILDEVVDFEVQAGQQQINHQQPECGEAGYPVAGIQGRSVDIVRFQAPETE